MRIFVIYFILLTVNTSCSGIFSGNQENDTDDILEKSAVQLQKIEAKITDSVNHTHPFPVSLSPDGTITFADAQNKYSGYYPGILWIMFELTGEEYWKNQAEKYTMLLKMPGEIVPENFSGHAYLSAYGNGYRLTGNENYRKMLVAASRKLISGFHAEAGCLGEVELSGNDTVFYVSPSHFMDLELLFDVSAETGEPVFANIAVKHAQTCLQMSFASDFEKPVDITQKNRMISFNRYENKNSPKSGQPDFYQWAEYLYGYTMVYENTGNPHFLKKAENIARFIIQQTKSEKTDAKQENTDNSGQEIHAADAAAYAIAADALVELAGLSGNKDTYMVAAEWFYKRLSDPGFSDRGENMGNPVFAAWPDHISGSPGLIPSAFTGYFFLKTLKRKIQTGNTPYSVQNLPNKQ